MLPNFYPNRTIGQEHGAFFNRKSVSEAHRLVLLRSPRSHVLSMFKMCRYSPWGIKLQKLNRSRIEKNGTGQHDFEAWLQYYLHPLGKPWLGCYEPWNYQARALTSSKRAPHNVERDFEPSFGEALAAYLHMDWVGLQDFYEESMCLFYGRLEQTAEVRRLLSTCGCGLDNTHPALVHIRHYNISFNDTNSSAVTFTPALAAAMDRITVVDKVIFSVALRGFFSELKRLEARLGRRIMCPAALRRAETQLAYIANVTAVYEQTVS